MRDKVAKILFAPKSTPLDFSAEEIIKRKRIFTLGSRIYCFLLKNFGELSFLNLKSFTISSP